MVVLGFWSVAALVWTILVIRHRRPSARLSPPEPAEGPAGSAVDPRTVSWTALDELQLQRLLHDSRPDA